MFDSRDSTGIAANDGMFGPDGGVGLDLSGWPLRLNIAVDVAKGMSYLHGEGIFHRDLTSKNVLVRVSTDSTGGCKVQSSWTQSQISLWNTGQVFDDECLEIVLKQMC